MKKLGKRGKKQTVCVIGLGYVGLPLAVRCAQKGYNVYGIDTDEKKIELINKRKNPFKDEYIQKNLPRFPITATADEKILAQADFVLICVPTPVDETFYPDLKYVISASEMSARNIKKGTVVILESTVNPGVSEEIIKPIFKKAGFSVGKDVFVAHCPERINPGDKKWNVVNIPRVVGAFSKKGLAKAANFYRTIVDAEIYPAKSIREAEAVKIVENSFRDVNIAFVNELAKSFDKLGIDVVDVIQGASTKPFAFLPHWPACGVGGHCIPVDPYYLIEKAKTSGFNHDFLKLARKINNSMPEYTVALLRDALEKIKKSLRGAKIGVLGISYKANVDDTRESPALKIIGLLKDRGARVFTFDPFVPRYSNVKTLQELLKKAEALMITADHDVFAKISAKALKKNGIRIIIDGKNCLNKNIIEKAGIIYKGIGH